MTFAFLPALASASAYLKYINRLSGTIVSAVSLGTTASAVSLGTAISAGLSCTANSLFKVSLNTAN